MKVNFTNSSFPVVRLLSRNQAEAVLNSTYEVLERTGVRVMSPEALALLKAAGALVEGDRVRIPESLVRWAISSAPEAISLYGRDGRSGIRVQRGNIHYGPGLDAPFVLDEYSGERRDFLRRDTRTVARLCDALGNIDFTMGLGAIGDVPPELAGVYEFAELVSWNRKPVIAWGHSLENLKDIHRIGVEVAGGEEELRRRPRFAFFADPLSPLVHTGDVLEQMLYCAEERIPFCYISAPLAGGTAPATLAGTMVLVISELLAGLTIHQLKRPGAPFLMGWVAGALDMRDVASAFGGPEASLLQMGVNDVISLLPLPAITSAGTSDAKCLDQQMSAEVAISLLAVSLSGPSLVYDAGLLESGLSASALMLVMGDEIIGMVKHILRGITFDDERLGIEDIDEAGPGGNHLGSSLTFKYYRTEYWYPTLMDRHTYGQWQELGEKTLGGRAQEKLSQILSTHEVPPLPKGVSDSISAILDAAKERLG